MSRTFTRLTIFRTRSERSSLVIICEASRFTPCALEFPWSFLAEVAPAACGIAP